MKTSKQKIYLSKIEKIMEYRKTHTLKQTGKKFNLTGERVRQIELSKHIKRKKCLVHNRYFFNKCSYCLNVKNYKLYMEHLDYSQLLIQVSKESKNKKRDYLSVQRRVYLIKRLYDKHEQSFTQIAELLDKDRSTIVHLYNKYGNK